METLETEAPRCESQCQLAGALVGGGFLRDKPIAFKRKSSQTFNRRQCHELNQIRRRFSAETTSQPQQRCSKLTAAKTKRTLGQDEGEREIVKSASKTSLDDAHIGAVSSSGDESRLENRTARRQVSCTSGFESELEFEGELVDKANKPPQIGQQATRSEANDVQTHSATSEPPSNSLGLGTELAATCCLINGSLATRLGSIAHGDTQSERCNSSGQLDEPTTTTTTTGQAANESERLLNLQQQHRKNVILSMAMGRLTAGDELDTSAAITRDLVECAVCQSSIGTKSTEVSNIGSGEELDEIGQQARNQAVKSASSDHMNNAQDLELSQEKDSSRQQASRVSSSENIQRPVTNYNEHHHQQHRHQRQLKPRDLAGDELAQFQQQKLDNRVKSPTVQLVESPTKILNSNLQAPAPNQKQPLPGHAGNGPPPRRSCSALGRTHINCDTLSQGAANQCDLNLETLIIESWLDDHPNFVQDYFVRKAPRQLIDDWLIANARVSSTSLRGSQFDLCSVGSSNSRPGSQLSLSAGVAGSGGGGGANLRRPIWVGLATNREEEQAECQLGPMRSNRSNSQSAASALAARSNTPIRKISATDFETRSGSGFLRPMLSKTPDGRFSFLPHSSPLQPDYAPTTPQPPSATPKRSSAASADANQSSGGLSLWASSRLRESGQTMGQRVSDGPRAALAGGSSSYSGSSTSTLELTDECGGRNNQLVQNSGRSKSLTDSSKQVATTTDEAVARHEDESEVKMIFELVKNIYDDLDIRTLLHKILKNIAVLINADRSSLFLVCGGPNDPKRRLVSQLFNVDQDSNELGEADEPITIPWGTGLVGYVAESGESVNIVDCYEDPRFTDAIDQRTGYVTRHMLCAPIFDKNMEIVGVAQVINKRDGNAFSRNDEIKFKRYLQFCGIGLRNAQSYEQCQLENRRNQVLLDLARMVFEEQSTIQQVVHRIMLHTQSLLDCERCQVLLVDNVNEELESLLQLPQARNQINCQSANTNSGSVGGSDCRSSKINGHHHQDSHQSPSVKPQPDWQPQCRLKDDTKQANCRTEQDANKDGDHDDGDDDDDSAREVVADGEGQLQQQQQQQQPPQQQPARLFSLVFDLECGENLDPVIYDSRSEKTFDAQGAPTRHQRRAFPINIGITSYVANTGETLNIENAQEHERFDASVDGQSDFKHRSILCMPIRNGQRQIIGVIQLINKKNGQPFNKNDEDLFEAFAIFCGLGIHNTLMYEQVLKVMAKQRVTFEVLSYHATAPLEEAKKLAQEQVPSCFALNLASLKFNDFSLDDQYMLKSCLRFFLDLDLMRRFQIDQLVFCNWILSVQKNYRKVTYHPIVGGDGLKASPVRYHNWRHAFNVSQMMFAILVNTQICQSLGELETLALLIACLCHDLDHRGTNNQFQIKSASPLAELYSTSTMEHHHFDQCVMILNSQGNQILANLSPQDYSRVIVLLEEAILATDLANYFGKRDQFFQLINSGQLDWRHDQRHRSLLRCMLMTACDIAAITKPWPVQKVVADLVMSEFYQQGDIERNELKIEPSDMMNRDKMSELPAMQIGFIDSICAPIYSAFARLFPQQLCALFDGCLSNRKLWCQLQESDTKPEISVANYLACDNDGPKVSEREGKLLPANLCISKSAISLQGQLPDGLFDDDQRVQNYGTQRIDSNLPEESSESKVANKLTLSSIDKKLAEAGLSSSKNVARRNDVQRKSI